LGGEKPYNIVDDGIGGAPLDITQALLYIKNQIDKASHNLISKDGDVIPLYGVLTGNTHKKAFHSGTKVRHRATGTGFRVINVNGQKCL